MGDDARAADSDASAPATIYRLRADLPADSLVGGAAAENHDLERVLSSRTPIVFGLLIVLGFLDEVLEGLPVPEAVPALRQELVAKLARAEVAS